VIFFSLTVLAAICVGALWAAEYDQGPLVINRQYQYRLVLQLGRPVAEMIEPGFFFPRLPLVNEVRVFDKRLQYLNAAASEVEIDGNERLIVDYYVIWQIKSPLEFSRSFPGGMDSANDRIHKLVGSLVGDAVGNMTMNELLARNDRLERLHQRASQELAANGVRVVDVRINRTELPVKSENATFEQMREQRRAISREKRAIGERDARKVRADADREAAEILANARADGEVLRGEGDAEAARIYASAYGKDPDFYAFVRSLEAYRKTLGERTTFVVPPDHPFFRFLDAGGVEGRR
jgi:membrane protease subunit HflC